MLEIQCLVLCTNCYVTKLQNKKLQTVVSILLLSIYYSTIILQYELFYCIAVHKYSLYIAYNLVLWVYQIMEAQHGLRTALAGLLLESRTFCLSWG